MLLIKTYLNLVYQILQKNNLFMYQQPMNLQKIFLALFKTIKALSLKRKDFNLQIISDGDTLAAHELARELGILNSFIVFHDTKTTDEIAKCIMVKKRLSYLVISRIFLV